MSVLGLTLVVVVQVFINVRYELNLIIIISCRLFL